MTMIVLAAYLILPFKSNRNGFTAVVHQERKPTKIAHRVFMPLLLLMIPLTFDQLKPALTFLFNLSTAFENWSLRRVARLLEGLHGQQTPMAILAEPNSSGDVAHRQFFKILRPSVSS